jgi:hypothetical protein
MSELVTEILSLIITPENCDITSYTGFISPPLIKTLDNLNTIDIPINLIKNIELNTTSSIHFNLKYPTLVLNTFNKTCSFSPNADDTSIQAEIKDIIALPIFNNDQKQEIEKSINQLIHTNLDIKPPKP